MADADDDGHHAVLEKARTVLLAMVSLLGLYLCWKVSLSLTRTAKGFLGTSPDCSVPLRMASNDGITNNHWPRL